MGFLLDIDYTCRPGNIEAWETLFLGGGWGVRDVRGPYMTEPRAVLAISSWALSARVGSQVHLRFGLSNRCPLDALTFNLSGKFGSVSRMIRRSSDVYVMLDDIRIEPGSEEYLINVVLHDPAKVLKFMDVLAIDRIAIQRSSGSDRDFREAVNSAAD
jgi:hypothetical protein